MAEGEPTTIDLTVVFRDANIELTLDEDASLTDLAQQCADSTQIEVENLSLFMMPKPGLQKHPFKDLKLRDILTTKTRIKVVGTPSKDIQKLDEMAARAAARRTARAQARQVGRKVKQNTNRDWQRVQDEAAYTFHAIEPLRYLPNPEKSRRYLERLANDPGIKASMRKHKFSVGLLTEMNPVEHTTHESRTLGLNRNAGEVIELRLRTDAYDGYRDYKVIRKTLCHELSHNVWGPHDQNFWNLTKQIEKEVEQNDHLHGGHSLTGGEFYEPNDTYDEDEDHIDGGGWTGGEFVLGGTAENSQGLSRREIMARAAQTRLEKAKVLQAEQESDTAKGAEPKS